MTNEEINEAIALKLGWVKVASWGWTHPDYPQSKHAAAEQCFPKDYAGSIGAAWEIVKHLKKEITISNVGMKWTVYIGTPVQLLVQEYADTAPLAICKAFLKLP